MWLLGYYPYRCLLSVRVVPAPDPVECQVTTSGRRADRGSGRVRLPGSGDSGKECPRFTSGRPRERFPKKCLLRLRGLWSGRRPQDRRRSTESGRSPKDSVDVSLSATLRLGRRLPLGTPFTVGNGV